MYTNNSVLSVLLKNKNHFYNVYGLAIHLGFGLKTK